MKKGWEMRKLEDLCDILDSQRKPITKSERIQGSIPYYGATGIQGYIDDFIFNEELVLIGEDGARWGHNEQSAYIINGKSWVNNHAHVLRISSEAFIGYLVYYLNYRDLNEFITGAVIRKLTQASMRKIEIPLPSIKVQQKIVLELDTLNAIITKKKKQLEELDKLAQATFHEMFGDPISNEKSWLCLKLGDLGYFKNGINYKQKDSGYSIHCVGVSDFRDNSILKDFDIIPKVSLPEKPSNEYMLNDGDILFVRSNGSKDLVGRNLCVIVGGSESTFSGFCIRFRLESKDISSLFLNTLLRIDSIKNMLLGQSRGCNISNLNQGMLSEQLIPIPPLCLQDLFLSRIFNLESQKSLLQQSLTDTQQLFDYTMNKYFGS